VPSGPNLNTEREGSYILYSFTADEKQREVVIGNVVFVLSHFMVRLQVYGETLLDYGVCRVQCIPSVTYFQVFPRHPQRSPPPFLTSFSCAGIFNQSMGARNRVGIGLSYRPARPQRLAESISWNRFQGSVQVENFLSYLSSYLNCVRK